MTNATGKLQEMEDALECVNADGGSGETIIHVLLKCDHSQTIREK